MRITFLTPPAKKGDKPAERTSGCTHVVYPTPNLYELGVVAMFERAGYEDIAYEDFVYDHRTESDLRAYLEGDSSDLYFMWSVNLSLPTDLATAALIHNLRPEAYVVFMGPGPTYFIDKCLTGERDIVVRGEPDETAVLLADALRDGRDWRSEVEGISYLHDGRRHNNRPHPLVRNLDSLPLPARHFIAGRSYHNPKLKAGPYTVALTSRNCPYHCIYCVPSSLTFAREIETRRNEGHKPFISFRSTESVDRELALLHEQGFRAIGFMDDNFIWNEKRTAELCASLRKYGFVWGCQARVDAITEPIAQMLGRSGCRYVDLGVESFDDDILKFIKKGITRKQIYEAIGWLKKYKVPVKLNILIGTSPLETEQSIKDTLRRAKRLDVDQVMINIVSPFPGTEFYDLARKNHWIVTRDYVPTDVQRESILSYPHLTARQMESLLFWENLRYFLSPRFVFKQLGRFRSLSEFGHALRALKIKLFG